MKLLSVAVGAILPFLASCKSPETMTLKIGSRSETIDIGDDWKSIQDEIISKIRPEWDGLVSGNSPSFHIERTVPDTRTQQRLNERRGDGVKVTATTTHQSPKLRFFRNRDGISGIEQMDFDDRALPMMSGASLEWPRLESYLREILITPDRVPYQIDGQATPSPATKPAN